MTEMRLKDILDEKGYKVSDEEIKKAFINNGYEELGVLLLELPEPRVYKYNYIGFSNSKQDGGFKVLYCQTIRQLVNDVLVHKCTRKEAEQFPQFKWVPLSELEG